ncbi:hypothetical protein PHYPSEUDO_001494 [Phytophthora pseudosyringae]|uniref:Transmembrane protein n=1 Tax=Phytophthora pseudosyringae TaxID=221518 RepID=A0A8T1VYV4_9STRA|nr:hypothetical protein PHYPSEUDO_001494 [Phytophthora pseudosyringae]
MLTCRNAVVQTLALTLVVTCWKSTSVSASAAFKTLFGRSDFHHQVTLASGFSPLEYLASFDLGRDGTFELALDVAFPVDTLEDGDDRVMLYLLACDESAIAFLNLPSNSTVSTNDSSVPSYCAMGNHTLDFYCQSFPLENMSPDNLVYQSKQTVTGTVDNTTSQSDFARLTGSTSTKLTFYIDACELLGGQEAILRSCLEYPPPTGNDHYATCYYCPENFSDPTKADDERWSSECVIPPSIREPVEGIVGMELCKADGECMWETDSYLVGFYAASTALWGLWGFTWMWHMHFAPTGSAVALHDKLMTVPITQVIYTGLSFAARYTAGQFASPNFNVIAIVALLAQVVALVETAEVALFIAAGWGITRPNLDRVDVFRIRCVSVEWALVFVVLKQLRVQSIGIAVIWGISWFSIMFLIHYYSTANLKMLRLRYRIGEQLSIDTSLVMWKGALFLHFRRLQKGFIFIATVTALTGSDNHWRIWEWISVQGHEILILLLYTILGYVCRCQQFRFSELENLEIETGGEGNEATDGHENGSADSVSSANVIPAIPEPVRKKITTALILNPDKSVMLGTAYAFENPENTPLTKETKVRATCEAGVSPSVSSPTAPPSSP